MELDDLALFYDGDRGSLARRVILRRMRLIWPEVKGLRLLGYGYALPYLRPFLIEAERGVAVMPAEMGVAAWPSGKCLSTIAEEDALPFSDAFFDRLLVVHGIEEAQSLRLLLRQLWRVLAPEGLLLVVAPNRASLWAQVERSPFAQGRPFSRRELDGLLKDALFEPLRWDRALYAPPLGPRALIGGGAGWERFGRRFFPALGGVHLVEAGKSLYAPVKATRALARAPRLSAAGRDLPNAS